MKKKGERKEQRQMGGPIKDGYFVKLKGSGYILKKKKKDTKGAAKR